MAGVRTCRYCGCTERHACLTPNGPCYWISADVCSAPACVQRENLGAARFAITPAGRAALAEHPRHLEG